MNSNALFTHHCYNNRCGKDAIHNYNSYAQGEKLDRHNDTIYNFIYVYKTSLIKVININIKESI